MASERSMTIQFPSGGLNRKVSYRQTPPYSSRRMKNVRVEEADTNIMRGGQRPGLEKYDSTEFGSGSLINMMGQVTLASGAQSGSGRLSFLDHFTRNESDLGGSWETPSWLDDQPATGERSQTWSTSLPDSGGGLMKDLSINNSAEYSISVDFDKDTNSPWTLNGTVTIYAMLDNTSPDFTKEGIAVVFNATGETGVYSGMLIDVNNYIPTAYALTGGTTSSADAYGKLTVTINSNNVKVYWGRGGTQTLILDQDVTAKSGTCVGFDLNPSANGNGALIDTFSVEGTASTARPNQLRWDSMVIGSGGNVYYENSAGTFTQASGASISSAYTIQCCQFLQKLYVADYNTAGTGVVHILDPSTGGWSTLTAMAGSVPTNCPLIARWHGRIVLAKESLWYMCAVNSPTDWQYGRPTATTAVASQNSEAGVLGEPIRALCPASDDLLIFGCDNSIWALHGDPAWHGRLQNLSEDVGVVDAFAWCFGPNGEMYFLSKDGFYAIPPGGNSRPQALSRQKIPHELLNIDTGQYEVTLGWSQKEHGVYIHATPYIASSGFAFFYQVETGTFWQDEYPNDCQPFRMFNYKPIYSINSALLFGCRDGYIRKVSPNQTTDDGTNIDSFVDIGPLLIAGDYAEGIIRDIDGYVAGGSGPVTWDLRVGDSSESVFSESSFTTGTWSSAGLQYRERPRARGHAAILRLGNSGPETWSIEKVTMVVEKRGRVRK